MHATFGHNSLGKRTSLRLAGDGRNVTAGFTYVHASAAGSGPPSTDLTWTFMPGFTYVQTYRTLFVVFSPLLNAPGASARKIQSNVALADPTWRVRAGSLWR